MIGSDFERFPGTGVFVVAIVAFCAIVICVWEGLKAIVPHIHMYWK